MRYSRETLAKYIDITVKQNEANHMVSEIMGEMDQVPVKFKSDEINSDELPKFMNSGELFTENPNYKEQAKDFSVFDSTGSILIEVHADKSMSGRVSGITFTVPFSSDDDKEAFLDFCDRLQKNHTVKYPEAN